MGTGGRVTANTIRRRAGALGLAAALSLGLVAGASSAAGAGVAPGAIRHRNLSTLGPKSTFSGELPTIRVTAAPKTKTSDRREAFYPAAAPNATDSQSCATWASETEGVEPTIQQGAVFRLAKKAGGGGYRAITVTKNIVPKGTIRWVFNFHLWDTSNKIAPFTQIGAVDLGGLLAPLGTPVKPLPWNFCARLVGSNLAFIVWLPNEAKPAWGDPLHGGSVTIPAGWTQPGKTGWFIGHLHQGETALLTNLTTLKTK